MRDPLERLGDLGEAGVPDLDTIRARAHRIQRNRRRAAAGLGAGTLALLAVVAVLALPDSRPTRDMLAEAESAATPGALEFVSEDAGDAASGAAVPEAAPPRAASQRAGGAAATAGGDSGSDEPTAGAEALEARLEVGRQPTPPGSSVRLTLSVCNPTDRDVVATFSTAQRYDFDVSRGGAVVWRWSDGQLFAQVVGQESWAPGACREWSESWDATGSAPGSYEAVGTLTSSPVRRSAPEAVCLTVCD